MKREKTPKSKPKPEMLPSVTTFLCEDKKLLDLWERGDLDLWIVWASPKDVPLRVVQEVHRVFTFIETRVCPEKVIAYLDARAPTPELEADRIGIGSLLQTHDFLHVARAVLRKQTFRLLTTQLETIHQQLARCTAGSLAYEMASRESNKIKGQIQTVLDQRLL